MVGGGESDVFEGDWVVLVRSLFISISDLAVGLKLLT